MQEQIKNKQQNLQVQRISCQLLRWRLQFTSDNSEMTEAEDGDNYDVMDIVKNMRSPRME